MGSRLKENPERTFYWFIQASCPIARDKDPGLLFQFPEDFSDEECLQSLPRFCFPYDIERVRDGITVQHFTFALTDLEGCQRFGFCRLTSSSQTCLCILSYLPWFEVFYKLLNNLADYVTKGQTSEMKELLEALYKHPVPPANSLSTLHLMPYFIAPDPKALPTIPENRNLTELIVAVDVGNLLQLYASMLFERRILICCSKLSTLTSCVHACSGMLYPMYWQHIFIPVLPPHLLDYCCAPMPYLIGVHSSLIERVRGALDDVVILNVDTNTMESPHDDLKKLPADVVTALKVRLKRQAAVTGCGVAKAFLRAQALLFGAYKDALLYSSVEPVSFSEDLFLTHKSPSMRQFLESAIHLQFFKQFIDGRLEMLNQGKEPGDLFEEEIMQCGASTGGSKSYQQWMGNLKKGGGSLILSVKSKAQMYKNVTCHSKLKNLISSKEQKQAHLLQRGGSVCGTHSYRINKSDCLQNRLPITQHFGKSRPRRPTHKSSVQQGEEISEDSSGCWGEESHVELASDDLTEEEQFSVMADLEEMDLLGEIFDTLNTQTSTEPGLLYSTRSLDIFTSDCTDFISRRSLTTPSQESLSLSTGNNGSLVSWEEGLEEGQDIEEEESGLPSEESQNHIRDNMRDGHGTLGEEEPCTDLGKLVEDLVDLRQELEEELNGNCKESSRSAQAETSGSSIEDQKETSRLFIKDQKETNTLFIEDQENNSKSSREDQEETNRSEDVQCETSKELGNYHQEKNNSAGEYQERTYDDNGGNCGINEKHVKEAIHKKHHAGHEGLTLDNNNPRCLPIYSTQEKKYFFEEQQNADTLGTVAKKEEGEEEFRDASNAKVFSKVALFQVKANQFKSSLEIVKPNFSNKIIDPGIKISPRGLGAHWATLNAQTDDVTIKSPTTPNSTATATEDEVLPPRKVSELKKRFEQ